MRWMTRWRCWLFVAWTLAGASQMATAQSPRLVGHRGMLHQAPENTLAGFAACLDLRLGFEVDVRRSSDGHLVCVHDDTVTRTTGGSGKVAELPLAALKELDAGRRFDPAFAGERVPTLDDVLALVQARRVGPVLVAIDLKIDDGAVEADVVRLARQHGVLGRLVCIGTAITDPAVRRRLRAADLATPVAVLAQTADQLGAAVADSDADWVYVRFVPTAEQTALVHRAGKKVFLVGPTVAGREPDNWRKGREAGVDAILTDFPLECREGWRAPRMR